jgi:hypothetical protein
MQSCSNCSKAAFGPSQEIPIPPAVPDPPHITVVATLGCTMTDWPELRLRVAEDASNEIANIRVMKKYFICVLLWYRFNT